MLNTKYLERAKPKIIKRTMEFFLIVGLLFSLSYFFKKDDRIPTRKFVLTSEIEKAEVERILNRREISLLNSDSFIKTISSFDVNKKGMIAVALDHIGKKGVSVYDSEGNYQYGYSFIEDGSYYVEWENDNLWIYFDKSDLGILLDRQADCVKCIHISDGYLGWSHWEELTYGRREAAGETYQLVRGKIIKTDRNGNKKVVYNASGQQIILIIAYTLGLCFVVKLKLD